MRMNKNFLAGAILALGVVSLPSLADTQVNGTSAVATGTVSSRTFADRFADTINIKDYGAVCDGTQHPLSQYYSTLAKAQAVYPTATALANDIDGVAIQSAVTKLASVSGTGARIVMPGGDCATNTTIDLSSLSFNIASLIDGGGTIIDAYGPVGAAFTVVSTGTALTIQSVQSGAVSTGRLYCPAVLQNTSITSGSGTSWVMNNAQFLASGTKCFQGAPVINAVGMTNMIVRDLSIYGENGTTPTPSIGLLLGAPSAVAGTGGQNIFENLRTSGTFAFSGVYNFSTEVTNFHHMHVENDTTAADLHCFGIVEDGQNHWGIISGVPTDNNVSFNENSFDGGTEVIMHHGCTPVWMADTNRHKWSTSYIQNATGGYGVILWNGIVPNQMLDMDVHMEITPSDNFYVDGYASGTTVTLPGFHYRDHFNQATNSVIKTNASIVTATMPGGNIEIGGFQATPNLLATPSIWTGNPDIFLPSATAFNWTTGFFGTFKQLNSTALVQSGTFANKPSSPIKGQQYLATDLGTGVIIVWNGTKWKPEGGSAVIAQVTTAATPLTGSAAETALANVAIPAGLVSASGGIESYTLYSTAGGSATNIFTRTKVSTTSGIAGSLMSAFTISAPATGLASSMGEMFNRANTSTQILLGNNTSGLGTGSVNNTAAVPTASQWFINITGQLTTTTDTLTLEAYRLTWFES